MHPYTAPSTKPLYRGTQVVWYILGIIEALLIFRFILKLLGANPAAGFTHFIYSVGYPFVAPFQSVFRTSQVSGSVFEWSTVLAMVVYWLIALAIIRLFVMSKAVTTPEAAVKLEEQE
ncbi:MAG: YggT family protein [Patescibacteria group bacterium]